MKRLGWLIIILALVGLGCARQVTTKSDSLLMDVTLTFRGNVDVAHYRYFIVFSPSVSPVLPSSLSGSYFPTPGSSLELSNPQLNLNGLPSFYQSYFSTWSDYVVITSALDGTPVARLYPSGGAAFSATTTQNTKYQVSATFQPVTLTVSGSQVRLLFPMSYFPFITSQVHFNFATSELLDGTESGEFRDTLDSESPVLGLTSGAKIDLRTSPTNSGINAATDLIGWEAQIR